MTPALIATEIEEGTTEGARIALAKTTRALNQARDQHHYWSWHARWRGGGPELRAHCQDQEVFFRSRIGRLEHERDSLLGKLAACAASPFRYLN